MNTCYEGAALAILMLAGAAAGAGPPEDVCRQQDAYSLGKSCLAVGMYEDAVKCFDRVIQTRPQEKRALRSRGFAHLLCGRPQAAIADFSTAMENDRRDAVLHYGRGSARALLGLQADAEKDLIKAVRLNPEYMGAHLALMEIRLEDGRPQEGLADSLAFGTRLANDVLQGKLPPIPNSDFGDGDQVNLDQLLAYACWRALYREYRAVSASLKDDRRSAEERAKDPRADRNAAVSCAVNGKLLMGRERFAKAIARSPKDPELYRLRGIIHAINQDWKASLQDFDTAVLLDPGDPEAYEFRGRIYDHLGDPLRGRLEKRKAEKIERERREAEVARILHEAQSALKRISDKQPRK